MRIVVVLFVLLCLTLGLAGTANAYLIRVSATDSDGKNAMTSLLIGDSGNYDDSQPPHVDGTVEMGLPTSQAWRPAADAVAQDWNYKLFRKPGPEAWVFALWGNDYAEPTANVKFWLQSMGNDSDLGSIITGQPWQLKDLTTNEVLWTGTAAVTGSEADPWCSVVLPVINTTTPHINAAVYSLSPVPEPASLLALGSGLLSAIGLVIRRRR